MKTVFKIKLKYGLGYFDCLYILFIFNNVFYLFLIMYFIYSQLAMMKEQIFTLSVEEMEARCDEMFQEYDIVQVIMQVVNYCRYDLWIHSSKYLPSFFQFNPI